MRLRFGEIKKLDQKKKKRNWTKDIQLMIESYGRKVR